MSVAAEDLAKTRYRSVGKILQKRDKLGRELSDAHTRLQALQSEKAAAARRDRERFATALARGKPEPREREEERFSVELEAQERRVSALELAASNAASELVQDREENAEGRRRSQNRMIAEAKAAYLDAIRELERARETLGDEVTLDAWLEGASSASPVVDSLSGRVGTARDGRPPLSFSFVLQELIEDAETQASVPATRHDPKPEPRPELATGGGGRVRPDWG